MNGPIRVLLADAAPLQRAGLRAVLTGGRTPPPPGDGRPTATSGGDSLLAGAIPPDGDSGPGEAAPPSGTNRLGEAVSPRGTNRLGDTVPPPGTNRLGEAVSPRGTNRLGDTVPPGGDNRLGDTVPFDGDARMDSREIIVAGEAGDGAEAIDLARRLLPDVLITDVTLPRLDGLAVARAVTEARLPVRVLLLTGRDTDEEVIAAVAAGAAGYLCKDAPQTELAAAVHAVAAGGAVITPPVLARMLTRLAGSLPTGPDTDATARLSPLTGREREVLVHVARGRSNSEIAAILGVSETTVKTHVGHVLTKLRLRDRTQAVVLAYETGLVRPGM